MKLLELFSGTGSVGKVAKELGYEVVSLDLKGADINTNIIDWDYTQYPKGHFDIVWASPPCATFSKLRNSHIGRGMTHESIRQDIENIGLPILRKAEEIIDYLKPKLWFIENPQTGRMKEYIERPFYDVDYCKYGFSYRKRTRIWTNRTDFESKLCKKDCGNIIGKKHTHQMGNATSNVNVGNLKQKYSIPPKLIHDLLRRET